jgi:carboxyl-terminal processing protease
MVTFFKRSTAILLALAVVAGSFAGGLYIGTKNNRVAFDGAIPSEVENAEKNKPDDVDFAPFWEAWQVLEDKYVAANSSTTISSEDKVWGAIEGLAKAYGDPYTIFFPPVEAKEFQSEISGNFEGVGIEMGIKDEILTVIAPLKDTPAYRAGIQAGDKIIKIDNTLTANLTVDEAIKLIRGKKGTPVVLTIAREKEIQPREIKIIRDVIDIPTIKTELRKDGVFVISLYSFSENSGPLFRKALQEFIATNSDKLILDLRGNPGGYLESSVDMASWFLPKDAVVVSEDSRGNGEDTVFKSRGYNVFKNEKLNMIILVNSGSASASEILAGALKEHGVAKLVGTKTYGKGSVQELVPITGDTSLKVTVARWLTPNGNSISEQGLTPDYVVEFTQEDFEKKLDPQLQKAVDLLLGK